MAHRRRNTLFNDLAVLPWWLNLAVGVGAFFVLRYAVPRLDPPAGAVATATPYLAWALLIAFSGAAMASAHRQWKRRRLLEQQTDLDSMRELPWDEFQQLVGEAYRRLGYHVRETGADNRHGGVDLVLRKQGQTTLVECKRWRLRQVRAATLRDLQGVMVARHAEQGLVVTTSGFTPEALSFASDRPIGLVDGPQLLKLVQTVRKQAVVPPRPASAAREHRCPHCGREMVLRVATKGAKAGTRYWSCTGFPSCKGTRPVGAIIGRSHAKSHHPPVPNV